MYSSTFSSTLAQDRVGGRYRAPAALLPGKRPGSHCIQVREWASLDVCVENLDLPGFDPRTVQAVTSRYTDCAIAAHEYGEIVELY